MDCITAHVQQSKVHICSMTADMHSNYDVRVKKDDKPNQAKDLANAVVARWRDDLLARKFNNSAQGWANLAGVSGTTITRNMSADYSSTSKLENLHVLAKAAGVPSVVDFLEGQIGGGDPYLPNVEQLASMIEAAMKELPVGASFEEFPRAVASGLHERLTLFLTDGQRSTPPVAQTSADTAGLSRSPTMPDGKE